MFQLGSTELASVVLSSERVQGIWGVLTLGIYLFFFVSDVNK